MMRRRLLGAVAAAALIAAPPAWSAAPQADPFAGAEIISDEDMADMRGGFALPNGVQVNFAATVNTYANGQLALSTLLTLSDQGLEVAQSVGQYGTPIQDLTPEQRETYGLVGIGGSGVVFVDDTGITALVQSAGATGLRNLVINTGAGRDLRQDIDVTITLPGFSATQQAIGADIVGIRIGADLNDMLVARPPG